MNSLKAISCSLKCTGSKFFLHPNAREKNIWEDLGLDPSLVTPQATALTTRPWLLGLQQHTTKPTGPNLSNIMLVMGTSFA